MPQTEIIDYRNARYQGQLNQYQEPHGLGIMIDQKNVFCLAEWQNGQVDGKCVIIFGDSKIFYGELINLMPIGVCTYHLKDKCQVFCNFEPGKPITHPKNKTNKSALQDPNHLVALLPTFNMIINVEGESEEQLQITEEEFYREGDFHGLQRVLESMLRYEQFDQYRYRFQSEEELEQYLSLEQFVTHNFKAPYPEMLDILHTETPEKVKEMYFGFKGGKSLGIKIQNCTEQKVLTNRHNDGNSYIVRSMGSFTKEGLIDQFGLKTIKTLIKGSIKEEMINYPHQEPIINRYEENQRPKECLTNMANYFKRSLNFVNFYLPTKYLSNLQDECLNINFNIKETETKKYAQLILENPKELTLEERERIEEGRKRNLAKGMIKKNHQEAQDSSTHYQNPFRQRIEEYEKKNNQLEKVKEDIYRSVSKKKLNTSVSYNKTEDHQIPSPEKDLKPAELTNIKPIVSIYKHTADKSFLNSIHEPSNAEKYAEGGYEYSYNKDLEDSRTHSGKRMQEILELNHKANKSFNYSENVERQYNGSAKAPAADSRKTPIRGQDSRSSPYNDKNHNSGNPMASRAVRNNFEQQNTQSVKANSKHPRNQYKYLDQEENPLDSKNDYKARVGRPTATVTENFSVYDSYNKDGSRRVVKEENKYFRAENRSRSPRGSPEKRRSRSRSPGLIKERAVGPGENGNHRPRNQATEKSSANPQTLSGSRRRNYNYDVDSYSRRVESSRHNEYGDIPPFSLETNPKRDRVYEKDEIQLPVRSDITPRRRNGTNHRQDSRVEVSPQKFMEKIDQIGERSDSNEKNRSRSPHNHDISPNRTNKSYHRPIQRPLFKNQDINDFKRF